MEEDGKSRIFFKKSGKVHEWILKTKRTLKIKFFQENG